MQVDDIRFLFAYDRWATRRILAACAGLGGNSWAAPNAIGERGLGGILVHQLGAHQRWRHGLSDSPASPSPEKGSLPSIEDLTASWEQEWRDLDAWLDRVDDAFVARTDEARVPFWQMLAHVVNHGTQHRAEAAALLTDAGHSPGDLDMIDFAEELARGTG